jgi:hypothetical protein
VRVTAIYPPSVAFSRGVPSSRLHITTLSRMGGYLASTLAFARRIFRCFCGPRAGKNVFRLSPYAYACHLMLILTALYEVVVGFIVLGGFVGCKPACLRHQQIHCLVQQFYLFISSAR